MSPKGEWPARGRMTLEVCPPSELLPLLEMPQMQCQPLGPQLFSQQP